MKIARLPDYPRSQVLEQMGLYVSDVVDHLTDAVQRDLDDQVSQVDRFNIGGLLTWQAVYERALDQLIKRYAANGLYGRLVVLLAGVRPLIEYDLEQEEEEHAVQETP